MTAVGWFLGFLALLVATLVASARGRATPADVVGRGIIALAGIAYVGIVVAAVWTWGGQVATTGRATQLRDGALVHLAVDGVRVPLTAMIAIGHGHDAALRIPGDGGELARIRAWRERRRGGARRACSPPCMAMTARRSRRRAAAR